MNAHHVVAAIVGGALSAIFVALVMPIEAGLWKRVCASVTLVLLVTSLLAASS